jgi:hypothetical protein
VSLPTPQKVWWQRVCRALQAMPSVPSAEKRWEWEDDGQGGHRRKRQEWQRRFDEVREAYDAEGAAGGARTLLALDRLGEHFGVGRCPR